MSNEIPKICLDSHFDRQFYCFLLLLSMKLGKWYTFQWVYFRILWNYQCDERPPPPHVKWTKLVFRWTFILQMGLNELSTRSSKASTRYSNIWIFLEWEVLKSVKGRAGGKRKRKQKEERREKENRREGERERLTSSWIF